jgi:Cu-Zn family superoxide dismutase
MKSLIALAALCTVHAVALGAEHVVTMNAATATGTGASAGSVRIVETPYGLAFYPSLTGLPPGQHGFHVHEKPSCAPAEQNGAMAAAIGAGGHLDPAGTKKHGEPWGDGHLGDLPPLYVAADGSATTPVLGPRLKLADVANRALMVHAGGDNHSDHPAPLGGGGARIVCGVIGR